MNHFQVTIPVFSGHRFALLAYGPDSIFCLVTGFLINLLLPTYLPLSHNPTFRANSQIFDLGQTDAWGKMLTTDNRGRARAHPYARQGGKEETA